MTCSSLFVVNVDKMLLITDLNSDCQQKKFPLSALICVLLLNCGRVAVFCDTLNEYKYMDFQDGRPPESFLLFMLLLKFCVEVCTL